MDGLHAGHEHRRAAQADEQISGFFGINSFFRQTLPTWLVGENNPIHSHTPFVGEYMDVDTLTESLAVLSSRGLRAAIESATSTSSEMKRILNTAVSWRVLAL